MNNHERLRAMLSMAAADDGVTTEELRLLAAKAVDWGITDDDFEELLDDAIAGKSQIELPESAAQRWELLVDLIGMMAADGKLHPMEKQLFALLAAKMEISPNRLKEAIDDAISRGQL